MHPSIPEPRQTAVTEALAATFGAGAAIQELEALKGGLSSSGVYRLRVGGRDYLLRLCAAPHAANETARHFACMAQAAEAGIAPRVFYANALDGVAITGFVRQRPLSQYDGGREALFSEAASLVRSLQSTAPFPAGAHHLDAADRFIAEFQATGLLRPRSIEEHLFRFSQLRAVWPEGVDTVSSHNDLNPGNVLHDGERLWFVDWEAAAAADPFGDPACLAHSLGADEAQQSRLLAAWLGRVPDAVDHARFHLMRQVWPMVQAMLILKGVAMERPDLASPSPVLTARALGQVLGDIGAGRLALGAAETRLEFGKALLDDLLVRLRAPRFDWALRVLAG